MDAVVLPRDELAHPESPHEWWYYSAFLRTQAGQRFHYIAAFMRWRTFWVSYMRWRDGDGREVLERLPEVRRLRQGTEDTLDLGAPCRPDWTIRLDRVGFSSHRVGPHATLAFRPGDSGVALHTTPEHAGIRSYGGKNRMAWYSRPSLEVVGTVTHHGERVPVTGIGWFEHQWGNTDFRRLAWRYIPLLFDDGRRAIAFTFAHRDHPGQRTTEVCLLEGGYARVLEHTTLMPLGPGGLSTTIVGGDTDLLVTSEPGIVDLRLPGVPRFFEGESRVEGTLLGSKVSGLAITEYLPV